ncbi:MAG: EAL domain-containing protein [Pseudomonadota bacterium]
MPEMRQAAAALAPEMTSSDGDLIRNALSFVRRHLDMEMAYLTEFHDDKVVFRTVVAPGLEHVLKPGSATPIEETYCGKVLTGDLPELIPDTSELEVARHLTVTDEVPIRSHISVPLRRNTGEVLGMFCCSSRTPRPNLNIRDLDVVRAFAGIAADQVNVQRSAEDAARAKRQAIEEVLDHKAFNIALQPIMKLRNQRTAGYEALCRFSNEPYRPPNVWFDDAAKVGLQIDLELAVMDVAVTWLSALGPECYLAVNLSPSTLSSGRVSPLVERIGGQRLVIEITEHDEISDLDLLRMEIDRLRDSGVRIAIDDTGAGYSGLQQILRLQPNLIKLDMSLTKDVDKDVARRSLAAAIVSFAQDTGATVVAEGIETEAELRTLAGLGVEMGQGYHLGRPTMAHELFDQTIGPKKDIA